MWLVQRGLFDYNLNINLAGLDVAPGAPITVETVNPDYYGEVTVLKTVTTTKQLDLTLHPQSVVLLTIPKNPLSKNTVTAAADATVSGGKNAAVNYGDQRQLNIRLDASQQENNKVSYIQFDLAGHQKNAQRVILSVNGKVE